MRPRLLKVLPAIVLVASLAVPQSSSALLPVLDARVVDAQFLAQERSFPMIDFGRSASSGDDRAGTTTWRVVASTGNCCENYLTSDRAGRIYDFGGSYINFTDDDGLTWKSVRPQTPLVNGEGAIALAPGGDVVGVQWDPYTGDHLLAFKYEASEKKWVYSEMPLHAPFYDREWIAAVPGPFEIDGEKVEYISFIKGAWPSKEAWFYSTDGINYDMVSSKFLDMTLGSGAAKSLRSRADAELDWIQPNTTGGIFPLGGGNALAAPDFLTGDSWALLDPKTRKWQSIDGVKGLYQADSAGRIHNVVQRKDGFDYRISSDSGRSWTTTHVALPPEHSIEEWDFRANLAVGIAAVAIHGHDEGAGADKDMLFKLDIRRPKARTIAYYQVGDADVNGGSGVSSDIRFDLETVTILPDGRVAMSFYDKETGAVPSLAIELP